MYSWHPVRKYGRVTCHTHEFELRVYGWCWWTSQILTNGIIESTVTTWFSWTPISNMWVSIKAYCILDKYLWNICIIYLSKKLIHVYQWDLPRYLTWKNNNQWGLHPQISHIHHRYVWTQCLCTLYIIYPVFSEDHMNFTRYLISH